MFQKRVKKGIDAETRFFLSVIVAVIAVAAVVFGIGIYGVYTRQWTGTYAQVVGKVLPLPAASINGTPVLLREYLSNLNSLKQFYQNQLQQGNFEQPTDAALKEEALERLIFDAFVREIAQEEGIAVSDDQVNSELERLISLRGDRGDLQEFLKQWYGWTIPQYVDQFLRPSLLYSAVNAHIQDTDQDNVTALVRMNAILEKLNNGEDFAELARTEGSDTGEESKGEIFVMIRGSFPAAVEDQLLLLPVGEHTDIITLDGSLQILKVEGRDETTGLLQLRRIYVPLRTVEDVVTDRRLQADIHNFVY